MAELATIARPYAEALFDSASAAASSAGKGTAGQWLQDLEKLSALVSQADVASALTNPELTETTRFDLLSGLVGSALAAPVAELLRVMLENGRITALPEVCAQFRLQKNTAEGVADCLIETAFPLEGDALNGLLAGLAKKFPLKLKPVVRVNSQLIGGVRVTVGDRVLDSSVRARLEAMQARLTA
jgi:F-type H+-transporting ATPase subunit delta